MVINNLPVFEAKIKSEEDGLWALSLVDMPAVEKDFVYFKHNSQPVMLSVMDEEKHLVTGCVMRAGFPIYRVDEVFGEYYIIYSAETIKQMAEKMMHDATFNTINIQHDENQFVDGVQILEVFIKDPEKGIDPKGFEDIEVGSLFATYKVVNQEVWEKIKTGEVRGFSLEGYFTIESTQTKTQNNMKKMIKKFMKKLVKMGSVETDKGIVYWVGEADLTIGDELFYDEGEEIKKVEDGDYTLTDGTVVVVSEGLVSEIRKADGEPEGELDMQDDNPTEPTEPTEPTNTEVEDLRAEIKELRGEIEGIRGEIKDLRSELEALKNAPAGEPIVEEFKKVQKTDNVIPTFGSRSRLIH